MKKSFYSLFAFAAILCACQANGPLEVNSTSAKKMTLSASIPSSGTKVVYEESMTDTGLSLKATWADKDTISVVSYSSDGNLISVDDFVCEGAAGKTTATFTGSLSEEAEGAAVRVAVYPRINADSERNKSYTIDIWDAPYLWMYQNDDVFDEPSEMERLADAAVLLGQVEAVSEDGLSVELKHQNVLVKVNILMPEGFEGRTLEYLEMDLVDENWDEKELYSFAAYNAFSGETIYYSDPDYPESSLLHGDAKNCSHTINEDSVLSYYMMLFPEQLNAGDFFFMYIYLTPEEGDEEEPMAYAFSNEIVRDVELQAGNVYTLTAIGVI